MYKPKHYYASSLNKNTVMKCLFVLTLTQLHAMEAKPD